MSSVNPFGGEKQEVWVLSYIEDNLASRQKVTRVMDFFFRCKPGYSHI
jgi:hypothetical protein